MDGHPGPKGNIVSPRPSHSRTQTCLYMHSLYYPPVFHPSGSSRWARSSWTTRQPRSSGIDEATPT